MEFRHFNTFEAVTDYKAEWDQLVQKSASNVPFLTFGYLQAWWQTRGGGEWPADSQLVLVTAFEGASLVGVAPLFYANNQHGKPALMFVGAIEVSDFLDFIVSPDNLTPFVSGLLTYLTTAEGIPAWETLDLSNLLEESPSIPALEKEAGRHAWDFHTNQLQPSPYIPLPGDFESYLAGIDKKQRHEIRRKLRNVEDSLAEGKFYFVTDPLTLNDEVEAFLDMMAEDPSKKAFLRDEMRQHIHNTAQIAFANGSLHLAFFTLDGNKAAANFSFQYNNRLWLYNSGWTWEYREFSPGWVLLAHLIQWANDNGIEEFDFMRGDEPYKYKFGAIDRHICRVTMTPTPDGSQI